VSQHQKGKTNLDLLEQEIVEWQWHQLASCSRQITMPVHHHSVFTGWMPFLPANQQQNQKH